MQGPIPAEKLGALQAFPEIVGVAEQLIDEALARHFIDGAIAVVAEALGEPIHPALHVVERDVALDPGSRVLHAFDALQELASGRFTEAPGVLGTGEFVGERQALVARALDPLVLRLDDLGRPLGGSLGEILVLGPDRRVVAHDVIDRIEGLLGFQAQVIANGRRGLGELVRIDAFAVLDFRHRLSGGQLVEVGRGSSRALCSLWGPLSATLDGLGHLPRVELVDPVARSRGSIGGADSRGRRSALGCLTREPGGFPAQSVPGAHE